MMIQNVLLRSVWKNVHGCRALWAGLLVLLGICGTAGAAPANLEAVRVEREAGHVANFWIGCEGTKCHPSVGSLFEIDLKLTERVVGAKRSIGVSSSSGLCTMSLIAPDQILTNAHCVKDGAKAGDSVTGTYAIFPATTVASDKTAVAREIERIAVNKVFVVSRFYPEPKGQPQRFRSPDFAILQLSRPVTGRPVLCIVQKDFQEGQNYRVVAMWPLKDYSRHPDPKLRKETPIGALQRNEVGLS